MALIRAVLALAMVLDVRSAAARPIRGGTPSELGAVVALRDESPVCERTATPDCSGVVIAPTVVLTAAHCVVGRESVEVVLGADAAGPSAVRAVAEIVVHPRYDATRAHEHDLALLRLSGPAGVAPLAIATTPPAVGDELLAVGYGVVPPGLATGVQHAGLARATAVGPETVELAPAPAMFCDGDSGGPLLRPGDLAIVAINRSGDAACAARGVSTLLGPDVAELVATFVRAAEEAAPPEPDPGADRCTAGCETDADCPATLRCADAGGERRCVHRGVPPGPLAPACRENSECATGLCAAIVTPEGRTCGCWQPCPAASTGCTAAGTAPSLVLCPLLLAIGGVRRRRRGRAAQQPPTYSHV